MLVLICLHETSRAVDLIERAGAFAVNVLSAQGFAPIWRPVFLSNLSFSSSAGMRGLSIWPLAITQAKLQPSRRVIAAMGCPRLAGAADRCRFLCR